MSIDNDRVAVAVIEINVLAVASQVRASLARFTPRLAEVSQLHVL